MSHISRRQFLKIAAVLTASLGWPQSALADVASGLTELASGRAPVLWLQGLSCSGCSVSFLNTAYPDPRRVLTEYISLAFNPTLSSATGEVAMHTIDERIAAGSYILILEGAVPTRLTRACRVGERDFGALFLKAAARAQSVIALGTCAAFGGIPAAPPNPTGAVGATKLLDQAGIRTPLINLPGCPIHPDWLLGTLMRVLNGAPLLLDAQRRPDMFYGSVIHSRCQWYQSYERGQFARAFGEPGCLFKLGCLGIRTNADCPTRRWNNKTSWCVEAGAPCVGCARSEFAARADFAFYRANEPATKGE